MYITQELLKAIPIVDIHVHLPGTISPLTAWNLGVRNKFITIFSDEDGKKKWLNGPNTLSPLNPHEHYTDIFKQSADCPIELDFDGKPINLEYNIDRYSFKSFDRVMATVQGHRHPPGGIQNEGDLLYVLDEYLVHCIEENICYVEIQQNIKIAYQIYNDVTKHKARLKFYSLLQKTIVKYQESGVYMKFLHCFNKTRAANDPLSTSERSKEAAAWLIEAQKYAPGVFVGLESAGHEKDESGWPEHLKEGYEIVAQAGLGCEAHGGEGIGVEHMIDVIKTLPITRLAHGFQSVEDVESIQLIKDRNIVLCISPIINMNLGASLHISPSTNHKQEFIAKSKGGVSKIIEDITQHPIFDLMRKYNLNITICSDNPFLGGVSTKEVIKILAGLSKEYAFSDYVEPLLLEELVTSCINGINAAFCQDKIKKIYIDKLNKFLSDHGIKNAA